MKITLKYLQSIECCQDAINKFNNTPELHDIDIDNIKEIITGDYWLYYHLRWLIRELNGKLPINKLTFKDSNGYSKELIYNKSGKLLTLKDSKGSSCEYTYDERGNCLTYKDSMGYSRIWTYNERGNELTFKDFFTGYWEERTYDDKGNMLTYKNSNGYSSEMTYDDNGNQLTLTFKDSNGSSYERTYDNSVLVTPEVEKIDDVIKITSLDKYDLTLFEIITLLN